MKILSRVLVIGSEIQYIALFVFLFYLSLGYDNNIKFRKKYIII